MRGFVWQSQTFALIYTCPCLTASTKVETIFLSRRLHVIGSSDLVDLWVIKIKSLWSFAHVVRRDHVNRARNADHAARTCERFVYSIVKITRLYDYQTWQTRFWRNLLELFSWLCFSDADWLRRQTPITWLKLEWKSSQLWWGVNLVYIVGVCTFFTSPNAWNLLSYHPGVLIYSTLFLFTPNTSQ